MITDLEVAPDPGGLPVVSWRESRGLHSPEALRLARIECRILKDAATGALLFAARGTVRAGNFEEAKPWEQLTGFDCHPAQALYYSSTDMILRRPRPGKSKAGEILAHDGAQVLRALFGSTELPIEINCADASPLELEKLQAALRRAFLEHRHELVRNRCKNAFSWPIDDDRIGAHDPARLRWPEAHAPSTVGTILQWALASAVVLAVAAAISIMMLHVFAVP